MEGREPRSGEQGERAQQREQWRRAAAHNLSAKREARARAAGVTFMQQCIHDATLEEERAAQRRLKEGGRAAADLEHARRTTYACTTQASLRQYVALTYRVPLISNRDS
jgi:hypothetical protein